MTDDTGIAQDAEDGFYEEPRPPLPPEVDVNTYLDEILATKRDPLSLADFLLLGTFYRWAIGRTENEAPAGAAHYANFYDLEAIHDLLPPTATKKQVENTIGRFEYATQTLMVSRSTQPYDPKRKHVVELRRGEVIPAEQLYTQYGDFTDHGHVIGRIALICVELLEMRQPGQEGDLSRLMELIQIQNRSAFDYYEMRMEAAQGVRDREKSIEEKHQRRVRRSRLARLARRSRNFE
ncbi:hypothetical protein [Paradevosia shaoguanensis]|uniref:hypothetical protein n=1 Tax=Paradevosia shaoguanensis TaxID=1335043 RepID=UPI0019327575|nr:hypothetical protein [Paradevosia shaoguanensis]